jgi:succinate dehydrogenase/fumarate reductase cytochrome b subunit
MLYKGERLFGERGRKFKFASAVLGLIGHMVGSGVLFVSFFIIGWLISLTVHTLDGIHKLPQEIMDFMKVAELWFMYFDAVLCAIVLLTGSASYLKEMRIDR